ncbi:type I secretion system permease/ATPase [Indioceanicola profundi]|uniref:type I secretion system permease/ATPase n=1 Tax=Indioceanicola profundi TaxID=2220096 RepID=UPI000E6AAA13|nr:type I secretion system permease/ATPase [Indioceanicola profundi]
MKTVAKGELRQAVSACQPGFIAAAGFSFFINILMLVSPLYMLQVYDRVLGSRSESTLLMLTVLLVGLLAVYGGLEYLRSRVLVRVSNRIDTAVTPRLFDAVYERSLRVPQASRTQPLGDMLAVRQFLTGPGLFAFFDAPWTPLFLVVIFIFHPLLGMLALFGAIVLFSLALVTETMTRQPLSNANREQMAAGQFAETNLRNAEVVEAMGMLPSIRERWLARHNRMLAFQADASDRAGGITAVTKFFRMTLQSLMLGAGAWLSIQGEVSPGVMIASSIMLGRALAPVEQAIGTWKMLLGARSAWGRLEELFAKLPPRLQPMPLPDPRGDLSVEGLVALPPGGSQPTLRGVSFGVRAGESVGIVGPSAAGKSTLVRTICGVWPVYAGKVRLDGADMSQYERERIGPRIGYLPQDVELFSGTIAENIARFGKVDAEKVVEAARHAGVHEMILRLAQGYDTQIGEGGSVLSAGQRQRVALARALYGNPSLVVLDEPNSNLDDEGEAALAGALSYLREIGSTVLIVAHRPSVLMGVDSILVLGEGQVQAYGPRQEIMSRFARPVPAAAVAQAARVAAQQSAQQPTQQTGAA